MFAAVAAAAQPPAPPQPLDLESAIAFAVAHHPALDEEAANIRAQADDVEVERARYTPELELFGQLDRGTANAVPGPLFPVPGLPVVSGTAGRTLDSSWGSAIGATASWDALGHRTWDAAIARAHAELRRSRDDAAARTLEIEYLAADRFITALERDRAVAAAKAGVDRAQVFVSIAQATVSSSLRAGGDLSRAKAELAFAQTALARAQAARDVSLADLREALGAPATPLVLAPGRLLQPPPVAVGAPARRDPRLVAADDRIRSAEAARGVDATGTRPRLALVGAVWARGNGALTGGAAWAHGLVPDAPNWSLGVVFSWPVFAVRSVAPAVRADEARVARERARTEELLQQLAAQGDRAHALLAGALQVAANTPEALRAAQDAEKQTTARYQAALATADDLAQAQRLLVQAETDDAVARLDVWRALLFEAYAGGDLAPFLTAYRGAP